MYGNNFFNPYMMGYQNMARMGRNLGNSLAFGGRNMMTGMANTKNIASLGSGIKGLFSKFNLSGFLNGASKTLNIVNQAIPVYYQVKPMINNAKTMFKIMGAVKEADKPNTKNKSNTTNKINSTSENSNDKIKYESYTSENPTFFI